MSDRLVDRIGALLAKAESTDSEHERDALISKAQELATANAISLEMARQRKADKTKRERPIQKTIQLFEPGDKSRTKSLFVWLWIAIASENDLKVNIYHDSSAVIAFGYESDISVTEMLYASLSVQMVAAAEKYMKSGAYKDEMVVSHKKVRDYWGTRTEQVVKPLSGQTARRNFYQGFTRAISNRLRLARIEAEQKVVVEDTALDETLSPTPAPADETAPVVPVTGDLVLREKREEVADFYKATSRARGSYRGGRTHASSQAATNAGVAAGQRASLGGSNAAVGGSPKAIS